MYTIRRPGHIAIHAAWYPVVDVVEWRHKEQASRQSLVRFIGGSSAAASSSMVDGAHPKVTVPLPRRDSSLTWPNPSNLESTGGSMALAQAMLAPIALEPCMHRPSWCTMNSEKLRNHQKPKRAWSYVFEYFLYNFYKISFWSQTPDLWKSKKLSDTK